MRRQSILYTLVLTLCMASTAMADPPRIQSVTTQADGDNVAISIRGGFTTPTFSVRNSDDARTVEIEIEGAALPEAGVASTGSSPLVSNVVSSTTDEGSIIRVELRREATYRASSSPGRIDIRLSPAGEATSGPTIQDVHLERRRGRDRVVVELSEAAEFRMLPEQEGAPARLRIRGVSLSEGLRAQLSGSADGVVANVRAVQTSGGTTIEVDRRGSATGTAIREGRRIVWLFAAQEAGSATEATTIARGEDYREPEEGESSDVAAYLTDVPLQVRGARGRRGYRGRRVDLDFRDADIQNILRLIAEVGRVNIVAGEDVNGSVTIRMTRVPWDQALDVILRAKGLGMVRRGNLIRVAPLSTFEAEREAAIARRKQQAVLAPLETRLIPVSYASAGDLTARVGDMISERGSVSMDERTNVLIVRDLAENLRVVEQLIRSLDTQTPQVLVEARIVEATSQYVRDVGIQWGGDLTVGSNTGNPTGLIFPSSLGVAGGNVDANTPTGGLTALGDAAQAPNFAVNLPAITGTGQGGALGLNFGSVGGNFNLNVRLSAAESNGVVRIVSSPRILTLDNHEAHIAQGTLIPYSQVSAQGVQTAFQEAKLELRVTPHVTADGSVSMHIKVTRDEPDFTRTSTRGDPTILKREAETDLLVPDGHTAVIGGIYTRNTGRNVDQVPFFGDIPVLGVLFQRRRVRDERNELLIFLTPRIVNRDQSIGP